MRTRNCGISAPTGACHTVGTSMDLGSGKYVEKLGTPGDAIGEYVATVAGIGRAIVADGRYQPSSRLRATRQGPDRHGDIGGEAGIRLRAAFGVNARADILAALLAASTT